MAKRSWHPSVPWLAWVPSGGEVEGGVSTGVLSGGCGGRLPLLLLGLEMAAC